MHIFLGTCRIFLTVFLCLLPGTEISKETLNQKEVKQISQRERRPQDFHIKRQHCVENVESQISWFVVDDYME